MGLDMYLEADISLSDHRRTAPTVRDAVKSAFSNLCEPDHSFIGANVTIPLAYWRKANHVHRWFVEHVQDGEDHCDRSYVSREQLQQLRDIANAVLADHSKAAELLPTHEGFFFGGTEYGDYYFSQTAYTVDALDRVLKYLPAGAEVYYQSSW